MTERAPTQTKAAPTLSFTPAQESLVQRKCACGGTSGLSGECGECQKKRLTLQRYAADRPTPSALFRPWFADGAHHPRASSTSDSGHNFAQIHVRRQAPEKIQTKLSVSQPGDVHEQEADQAAAQVVGSLSPVSEERAPASIPPSETTNESQTADTTVEGAPGEESPEVNQAAAGLIIDDEAQEVGAGQMRKSEFLEALRSAACAAADAELAAVGQSTQGCPYIERALARYRARSSQHVERAIRKYAPETANATSAQAYIPLVSERMRRGVATWAVTGRITGVPEELAAEIGGGGILGAIGGLFFGVASAASGLASGIGGLFAKAGDGGVRDADPRAIRSRLRAGRALESGVRSRMESAFGHDFSRVRLHTNSDAVALSTDLNARAFTTGTDIAFGAGEYQPGTLVGDALLAHELAHVVQQSGAADSSEPLPKGGTADNALEEAADQSAVGAVVALRSGTKGGLADLAQKSKSGLRSGLQLQRCGRSPKFSTATCANPVKTLSVDLVSLRGSSRNPTSDLAFANRVFQASCVQFSTGKNETVANADSDSWLGGDKELSRNPACGAVHAEETAMYNGSATKFGLTGRFRAFYVASIDPGGARAYSKPPYCATGAEASQLGMVVVTNDARDRSLAHEFGHILLNSGSHTGIDNPADTDNLMVPTNAATGEVLDATQIATIYANA